MIGDILHYAGILLLAFTAYILIKVVWRLVYNWWFLPKDLANMAAPPASLLWGNFLEIAREDAVEPHLRWCRDAGWPDLLLYRVWLGEVRLLTTDLAMVKHIFLSAKSSIWVRPADIRNTLKPLLGDGLLTSEGEKHDNQRRLIGPAFSHRSVGRLMATFNILSAFLVKKLEENEGSTVLCHQICSEYTLDVIGQAGFSFDFEALKTGEDAQGEDSIYALMNTLLPKIDVALVLGIILPFTKSLPTSSNKAKRAARDRLHANCLAIIEQRRKQWEAGDAETDDLLSVLFEGVGDEKLSDDELLNNVLTFVVAGHETTAIALSASLAYLAQNPEWIERAREEIEDIVGDGNVQAEHLEKLVVVTAIFNETMRLFPPAPLTNRVNTEEDRLGDVLIPKGTIVMASPFLFGRDARIWGDDVLEWRPSRFLDAASVSERDPFAFMPFMMGKRGCVGKNFAVAEAVVAIVHVVRALDMEAVVLANDMDAYWKRELKITMRPSSGLPMKFTPR